MKNKISLIYLIISIIILSACNNENPEIKYIDGFEILIEYLENENGDLINSEEIPFFINADEVYNNLNKNLLIIDIRSIEDFDKGHIINAVNISPNKIIDYFENHINPNDFDKIVLTCNAGDISAFCVMGLKYLGYNKVYPLRNGLSSWSYDIAKEYRLKNLGNHIINNLDTLNHEKNKPGDFPVIKTKHSDAYNILRSRIIEILNSDISSYFISLNDFLETKKSYYNISYWPETRFNKGHIDEAIRYQPKSSLRSDQHLNTLPIDKPIIIDCYAGNHSNFVLMYLRILGYDAHMLISGANSYMYDIIMNEERASRHFGEKDIYNYPLSTDKIQTIEKEEKIVINTPVGGC